MVDAIMNIAPQQVAPDNAASSSKPADADAKSSFDSALNSAMNDHDTQTAGTDSDSAQPHESSDSKDTAAEFEIAGAVQTAMAIPAEVKTPVEVVDLTSAAPSVVAAVEDTVSTTTAVTATSPQAVPAAPVQSVPQQAIAENSIPVAADAQADQVPQAANASEVVQSNTVAQTTTEAMAQRNANAMNQMVAQQTQTDDAAPATQEVKPETTGKSEKGHAALVQDTRTSAVSDPRIPVESVPVQWRFDASSQNPRFVIAESQANTAVASIANTGAQSASSDGGSSLGQNASNAQFGVPPAMQFANQLRATTQPASVTTSVNTDLQTRVVDQVVREVKLHKWNGGSDLIVNLNPPDLGSLRLQITQDATGLTSHIQASNNQVRGLLEAHLPALMDALSNAGLRMDSVSVSVAASSQFGALTQNPNREGANADSGQARQRFTQVRGTAGVGSVTDVAYSASGGGSQVGYSWLA